MDLMHEFQSALQDGLGKAEAASYKLILWTEREMAAVAYSHQREEALLLFFDERDFSGLSEDEYLDAAKSLNHSLSWFCAPAHRAGHPTMWGGKTIGPVYVYRFNVLSRPKHGDMA